MVKSKARRKEEKRSMEIAEKEEKRAEEERAENHEEHQLKMEILRKKLKGGD